MKTFLAAVAFAAVALPSAAFAADGMEKCCCCCEKMQHEGADCCDTDKQAKGEHAEHAEHAGHMEQQPAAPAQ